MKLSERIRAEQCPLFKMTNIKRVRTTANKDVIADAVAGLELIAEKRGELLKKVLDHGERCNWFADRMDRELVAEIIDALEGRVPWNDGVKKR